MRSPTKFEDLPNREARNSLIPLSGQYRHHRPRGRWPLTAGQTWIEAAILKMAAQITIVRRRLVDTIVLGGMGLPTAGVDSRSKSPTDPTALAVRQ